MADKDALRELQDRLATQLQAAREQDRGRAWLAVEAGSAGLLLPLADAGEIFPFRGAVGVPHARPWFLGVANLRGALHGVVDLASFLGLAPATPPASADATGWLVVLSPRLDSHAALRVDRLAGLRREDQLQGSGAPPGAFAGERFVEELPAAAGQPARRRWWQELRLAELASNPHFVDIAQPL